MEELVVIATANDVTEAKFIGNHLEAAGYDVFIADNHIVGTYNWLASAVGWIKIKVLESQAQKALEFVENLRNADIIWEEPETGSWKED